VRPNEKALQELEEAVREMGVPSIGPEEGKLVCLLAQLSRARRALELGTGVGYSTYWLGLGVGPEGSVESVELDIERAERARALLRKHGLAHVNIVTGEALNFVRSLPKNRKYDLIFVDVLRSLSSEQEGRALARLLDVRLQERGLLLADNAQAPHSAVEAFVSYFFSRRTYFSAICPVREGLLISYRRPRR